MAWNAVAATQMNTGILEQIFAKNKMVNHALQIINALAHTAYIAYAGLQTHGQETATATAIKERTVQTHQMTVENAMAQSA
jgi:hypothetical protein